MYPSLPPIPYHQSTTSISKPVQSLWPRHWSKIHILDNDSLLHIFYFCRQILSDEDMDDDYYIVFEKVEWNIERWWYKIAQVCRRWRFLVLSSPSHLGLYLLCANRTHVADMLAHSPALPLAVYYHGLRPSSFIVDEGEQELLFALRHRDRVRRIRLCGPAQGLQKFIIALVGDFPMLEHLYIRPLAERYPGLILPKTLQAPHLRHLILHGFALPILPTAATDATLITLSLKDIYPYPSPDDMIQKLSLMLHLETLNIAFPPPVPNRDFMRQLLRAPVMTHAMLSLPNLRRFQFTGTCAYLEALLPRLTTPRLEELSITFSNQPTFSPPHLLEFMMRTEDLRFGEAEICFSCHDVKISASSHVGARAYSFDVTIVDTRPEFDLLMAWAVQISNALSIILSKVVDLTLSFDYRGPIVSPHWHPEDDEDEALDDAELPPWCELLRSFSKVKTLVVDDDFIRDLSRCLRSADEKSPMELLPELKKIDLPDSISWFVLNSFTSFLSGRQHAGYPVALVCRGITLQAVGR